MTASIVVMQKNFFNFFARYFFLKIGDHFLQDFLMVYCFDSVALIHSVLIQKTLRQNHHQTFAALRTTLAFLGLAMLTFSFVNSVALILGRNETSWIHPQLSHYKNSVCLSPWNCAYNSLQTATWCAIFSCVSKHGTRLHDTCHFCKLSYKIANALRTKMFKHCASPRTVILRLSHTITATVFCRPLSRAILGCPSCGSVTTLSRQPRNALYQW